MDKYIGKKLDGRYEITELIGIGGMADVYKAVDLMEDNKVVAVKILKSEFADSGTSQRLLPFSATPISLRYTTLDSATRSSSS